MTIQNKLVYGVGINDADYVVQPVIEGKRHDCPYYRCWVNMLMRCYSPSYKNKKPTYDGCYVHSDWLVFSKFRCWMETQDWVCKHLDKDILYAGNKEYSSKVCVFVDHETNMFLTDSRASRGSYLIGVSKHKEAGKFLARCCDSNGKQTYLGLFKDEESAHIAWKSYKHGLACKIADKQTDPRIAEALRKRFALETNLEKTL